MANSAATTDNSQIRELTVPAEEGQLGRVRDFVVETCELAGLPPRETSNTKLAVDEACTNIIKHAYEDGEEQGDIKVSVAINPGEVRITLRDRGKHFDFASVKDPDLDQYVETGRKGGLGVFLINRLMDGVEYHGADGGNELILTKRSPDAFETAVRATQQPLRGTLRYKFTMRAAIGLAALMVVLWGVIMNRQGSDIASQRANLWTEQRRLAENLASRSVDLLMQPDELSVEQTNLSAYLARLMESRDELDYVHVVDRAGEITSSSDINAIFTEHVTPAGEELPDLASRATWIRYEDAGEACRDISVPVRVADPNGGAARNLGRVHVGVIETAVEAGIDDPRTMTTLILISVFLVGVLLIIGLVQVFVRPIQVLTDGVRAIGDGNLEGKLDIRGPAEIGAIASVFNEITDKFKVAQNSILEQEKIQKEMEVAKEIQHSLLPRRKPEVSGYDIAPLYQAAAEVGGDYYDFVQVDEDTVGVVVADVSGKGVPGSLVMTMIRTALRMEARGNKNASDVMAKMNAFVTDDMKKGMFVTMFYVILDSQNRTISYASAGHNPMILFRAETNETFFLNPKGFPVGISLPDEDLFRQSISLEKIKLKQDDMLLIYTDGVTEAMNERREQYGEERLIQTVKKFGKLPPEEFIDKLEGDVRKFTAGYPQNDDITVVAVKEKASADEVLFGIRKRLIELVDVEGLSVKDACAQMRVSPATYYRYKKRLEVMGERGLQNKVLRSDVTLKRLSLEARKEILEFITEDPDMGPKRLAERYNEGKTDAYKVTERMVYDELKRMNINTRELRIEYLRRNRLLKEDDDAVIRPEESRDLVDDLLQSTRETETRGPGDEAPREGDRPRPSVPEEPTGKPPEREVEEEFEIPDVPPVEERREPLAASISGDHLDDDFDFDRIDAVGLDAHTVGDVTVVTVNGHIDSVTSSSLEDRIHELVGRGCKNLVVDLTDVTYISSGGWGVFTGEVKPLREQEGDIVLAGMSSEVYDVYELLGFADLLRAFATTAEARHYFEMSPEERAAARPSPALSDSRDMITSPGLGVDVSDAPVESYSREWESLKIEATTVGSTGDIAVLTLSGIIDTVSAEHLRGALDKTMSSGILKIVVDMSQVEYVSSGGWGTFTERLRELRRGDGDIKLFGMDADVYYVFTMLGFNIVLSSFDVLADAIEDFSRAKAPTADEPAKPQVAYEESPDANDVLDAGPGTDPDPPPQEHESAEPQREPERAEPQKEPEQAEPPRTELPREFEPGTPAPGDSSPKPIVPGIEHIARDDSQHVVIWEDKGSGVRVGRLHGPIEASAVEQLSHSLEAEFSRRPRAVLLDFRKVPYVSSTGWGQVARAWEATREWGGWFGICALNGDLYDIFSCLEFHNFVTAYDGEGEAITAAEDAIAGTTAPPPSERPRTPDGPPVPTSERTAAPDPPDDEPMSIDDVLGGFEMPAPPAPSPWEGDDGPPAEKPAPSKPHWHSEERDDATPRPAADDADTGGSREFDRPAQADDLDVGSAEADKNIDRDRKIRKIGWAEYGERLRKRASGPDDDEDEDGDDG